METRKMAALSVGIWLALAVSAAAAETRLNGDQISVLIKGNTTYGKHTRKDSHGYAYWRPDGSYAGWNSDRGATAGSWRVADDKFCRTPQGESEGCREIYDRGDGTYAHKVEPKNVMGPRQHIWTWTKIVEGNAENL